MEVPVWGATIGETGDLRNVLALALVVLCSKTYNISVGKHIILV